MNNPFSLKTSIQKRLSFYVCIVILCVVIVFGSTAYFAIQRESLTATKNRIFALTEQVSSMFNQFAAVTIGRLKQTGQSASIQKFLGSKRSDSAKKVLQVLISSRIDTLERVFELYNSDGRRVLTTDTAAMLNAHSNLLTGVEARNDHVGKMYQINGRIYYPIIAAITNNKTTLGYIVAWRQLVSSPQQIAFFSNLIGQGGALIMGNNEIVNTHDKKGFVL